MPERSLLDVAKERYLGDFARLEADAPARRCSWTQGLRREALERFAAAGFPTPRQEAWRKTGILPILKTPFRTEAAGTSNGFTADEIGRYTFEPWECTHLVFVNGHYAAKLSRLRPLPAGVVIEPLSAALEARRDEIEPHLGRHAGLDGHAFAALNTAFMQDGVFVRIPDGVAVEEPIHLLFITNAAGGPVVLVRLTTRLTPTRKFPVVVGLNIWVSLTVPICCRADSTPSCLGLPNAGAVE